MFVVRFFCKSGPSVLSKPQNVASCKQCHMIAWELKFSGVKDLGEIPLGSAWQRRHNRCAKLKSVIFNRCLTVSQKQCKIGHIYCGSIIGTCMHFLKWCYFQWPWMAVTTRTTPFCTFCIACYVFVTRRHRDYKFSLEFSGPLVANSLFPIMFYACILLTV